MPVARTQERDTVWPGARPQLVQVLVELPVVLWRLPAVVLVPFLAHEGEARDACLRQGWIFTFRALLVLGERGQTHHCHQGRRQEPDTDLCGG